jgi:hypothetical protein
VPLREDCTRRTGQPPSRRFASAKAEDGPARNERVGA